MTFGKSSLKAARMEERKGMDTLIFQPRNLLIGWKTEEMDGHANLPASKPAKQGSIFYEYRKRNEPTAT